MSSFPSPTLTVSVRPLITSRTPYSLSRIFPLLRPPTPPSSITTSSMRTSLTPPHPTLTLILTLTPLFRPQYRREQRVYPPLPSLRSARALLPTPSHRLTQHPSPDELGPSTSPPRRRSTPRLRHLPRPPLSPPSMYVGGGTRGLRGDVLSWILPTKSPTGEMAGFHLSPIAHHRNPL